MREAPCPVLTLPPQAPARVSEAVTFKRILFPIDFSPSALQALGFALDLARQADGRVTLFHSFATNLTTILRGTTSPVYAHEGSVTAGVPITLSPATVKFGGVAVGTLSVRRSS